MKKLLITIDGPAGAGKTTISRNLADRLGYRYIDTGALYRGIAYKAQKNGIEPDDDPAVEQLCSRLRLDFVQTEKGLRLVADDVDISDEIRTPGITMLASAISARPLVRAYLLDLQRDLGKGKGVVFEGRDMGTVVFPDADLKFFLDASTKTRALRRFREQTPGTNQSLADVERDIIRRDENDSTRSLAPLRAAPDAIVIDSTELSIDQVVEKMIACFNLMVESL
jgi:cytidylate kinase